MTFTHSSLAETRKYGTVYNSTTQEKCVVLIVVHTEWERWVDLSACNHPFSSLISISNEGSNIVDLHVSAFSVKILVPTCLSTHATIFGF